MGSSTHARRAVNQPVLVSVGHGSSTRSGASASTVMSVWMEPRGSSPGVPTRHPFGSNRSGSCNIFLCGGLLSPRQGFQCLHQGRLRYDLESLGDPCTSAPVSLHRM